MDRTTTVCATAVVLGLALFCRLRKNKSPPNVSLGSGSFVAPGWERVEQEFRKQLRSGLLKAGGFCVYYKGECVVELTGGIADDRALTPWGSSTLSSYFSTTKGVASVVIAMLVDRGLLDYNKPVSHYWPEFAQNGKKDITILQLVSHQAGLISVKGGDYSLFDLRDENADKLKQDLAAEKPYWEPGTGFGYHTLTKGLYEDALVRIVDPKHRSMQQFFKEEVADGFDIDFHIGVPSSEFYRMAQSNFVPIFTTELLTDPSLWPLTWRAWTGSSPLLNAASTFKEGFTKSEDYFSSLPVVGYWRNPEFLGLGSPATHGVGTVRSLAKFYGILSNGGVHNGKTLLSKEMIKKLGEVVVSGTDKVLTFNWTIGPGMMLLPVPKKASDVGTNLIPTDKTGNLFGTPGAGGQMAFADTKNRLGFSYLTNYMSNYIHSDPRCMGLMRAMYESLEQITKTETL